MVTRVNGFSGMDIDSMVKSMMTAKRVPLDKLNQQKQILNWTRDSYREVNSKLVDFRTNKLTDKYGVNSAMNANKAVTSGNTDALTAEATATANGIDMKVSITQLATKATIESKGAGSGLSVASSLAQAKINDPNSENETVTDADKAEKYSLEINGETFSFTGATGISTVIATINGNSKANAMASFDEVTGKLIISSKTSGSKGELSIKSGNDTNLFEAFKGVNQYNGVDDVKPGVDAIIFVNDTMIKKDSNTFLINGIQMTLLATTYTTLTPEVNPPAGADKPITIKTQSDPQKAVDAIKGFVEDYNSLLTLLNGKISEEKYRDFAPLTDEQKTAMKEADITTWTEKAKSGLLKNDDILREAVSSLRGVISNQIGALSSIGVTTGSYYEGGKLKLDEAALKKALANDAQGVMDLFQGPASASNTGIFDKLASKVNSTLDTLVSRVGTNKFSTDLTSTFKEESIMGKKLKEYNTRITSMLTMLNNAETRFYKQFSAMETAMNKLQTQSSSLFSTSS
ncbi:flagellar filament capping protein FliD [Paenibacillus sp. FSL R10-2734]|uniref:flagellar filament capping protein FliD n=1 Tax=Paenibacillus sp. FSL R10-2734 TaxID=2954691 RepID=UPI0030DAE49D